MIDDESSPSNSDMSWPRPDPSPQVPYRKRPSSPSMSHDFPAKHHHSQQTNSTWQSSPASPYGIVQDPFPPSPQHRGSFQTIRNEDGDVDQRIRYASTPKRPPREMMSEDFRQNRYLPSSEERVRQSQVNPHISPHNVNFRGEVHTPTSLQSLHRRRDQEPFLFIPENFAAHFEFITDPRRSANRNILQVSPGQPHLPVQPIHVIGQQDFRRARSIAPEEFRPQTQDDIQHVQAGETAPRNAAQRGKRLGSPIWVDERQKRSRYIRHFSIPPNHGERISIQRSKTPQPPSDSSRSSGSSFLFPTIPPLSSPKVSGRIVMPCTQVSKMCVNGTRFISPTYNASIDPPVYTVSERTQPSSPPNPQYTLGYGKDYLGSAPVTPVDDIRGRQPFAPSDGPHIQRPANRRRSASRPEARSSNQAEDRMEIDDVLQHSASHKRNRSVALARDYTGHIQEIEEDVDDDIEVVEVQFEGRCRSRNMASTPITPRAQRERSASRHPHHNPRRQFEDDVEVEEMHFESRSRSRNMASVPITPTAQRQRSASRHPNSQTPHLFRQVKVQTPAQPAQSQEVLTPRPFQRAPYPSVTEILTPTQPEQPNSPEEDSTPLNDLFRRKKRVAPKANGAPTIKKEFNARDLLPQESLFHNERQKPQASKSWTNAAQAQNNVSPKSPVIISLLSSPETVTNMGPPHPPSPPVPVVKSTPMKERLAPAKKPALKKKTTTPKTPSTPKTSRRPKTAAKDKPKADSKEKQPAKTEQSEKHRREMRAAEIIVNKELNAEKAAMEIDIFGEIVEEDEESKKAAAEEARLEAQKKREQRQLELLAEKEAKEEAEREKQREEQEAAEKLKKLKEEQEARDKVRRAAERKKLEQTEQAAIEEKRKKAQEKIEKEREERRKAEEEKREKEKERLKVSELEVLALFKQKQEEAKKQVASLSALKVSDIGEPKEIVISGQNGDSAENGNADGDVTTEESLFVNDDDPPTVTSIRDVYDVDERRLHKKSVAPTTAAELVAQAQAKEKANNNSYRAQREALEAERLKEQAERHKANLLHRWANSKQTEAKAAPRPEPGKEKPKAKAKKDEAKKKAADDDGDNDTIVVSVPRPLPKPTPKPALAPVPITKKTSSSGNLLEGLFSSALLQDPQSSFSSTTASKTDKPVIPPLLPPLPPFSSSTTKTTTKLGLNLISDAERQRLDRDQERLRQSTAKKQDLEKKARQEILKAERRKKVAEQAREKKKQQFLDEAAEKGDDLSEVVLNEKLDAWAERREKDLRRKAETRLRNQQLQDFAPDNLTAEALSGLTLLQSQDNDSINSPYSDGDDEDEEDDDDSEEGRKRRELMREARESLNAMAKERGARFRRATRMKTIADFPDSEESEEDPDPVHDTTLQDQNQASNPEESDYSASGDEDDNEDETAFRPKAARKTRQLTPHPEDSTWVRVYTIFESRIQDGREYPSPFILGEYADRSKADKAARSKAQEYRNKRPQCFTESEEDGFYKANITFNSGEERNESLIYISAKPMAVGEAKQHTKAKERRIYPLKTYVIKRTLKFKPVYDPQTGEETKPGDTQTKLLGNYTGLELANNMARGLFIDFLRPTNAPRIQNVEEHRERLTPLLEEHTKQCNEAGQGINAPMDFDEDTAAWMMEKYEFAKFKVYEMALEGPLN
ncbi:hypothetical protein G7Y89_g6892 [Cudoniella acicularis]|uniref:Uncharacterized protein n=1 Tax=Cudoniella acicularis TaxID=354080 RepID=A0A8H4RLU4_9HELO|nr:hypothetical protein G7Y89_g6892 [Cudoniella acicularis]